MPDFKVRPDNLKTSGQTIKILKKAWDELPADFSTDERSLFIEIAERIIKIDPGEVN